MARFSNNDILKTTADELSRTVITRIDPIGESTIEEERCATSKEQKILYNIFYGALCAWSWNTNGDENVHQILDSAEDIAASFFESESKMRNHERFINTYSSVYIPLKNAFNRLKEVE